MRTKKCELTINENVQKDIQILFKPTKTAYNSCGIIQHRHPKSSPVRPLFCNWAYYCAQFSQSQGCVCTALQLSGDVNLGL